jgi:hypothetical protein
MMDDPVRRPRERDPGFDGSRGKRLGSGLEIFAIEANTNQVAVIGEDPDGGFAEIDLLAVDGEDPGAPGAGRRGATVVEVEAEPVEQWRGVGEAERFTRWGRQRGVGHDVKHELRLGGELFRSAAERDSSAEHQGPTPHSGRSR